MTTKVAQIEVGPMSNFSYIIADDNSKFAAIVDPSWDLEKILKILENDNWQAKMIINTHNHFDHIQGNEQIAAATGAPILQYARSSQKGNHVKVKDGEQIKLGNTEITILHTPGHSKESICLLVDDRFVFTGDTLFVESCGRIDLAGGDVNEMYDSLLNKVRGLNDELIVYPGHNYGSSPWSTMGKEKNNNPTLQPRSRQDFIEFMTS
ncbi:MAG: MBL fold metallo-hydrolase [Nitrososphaeraceae archaeon]